MLAHSRALGPCPRRQCPGRGVGAGRPFAEAATNRNRGVVQAAMKAQGSDEGLKEELASLLGVTRPFLAEGCDRDHRDHRIDALELFELEAPASQDMGGKALDDDVALGDEFERPFTPDGLSRSTTSLRCPAARCRKSTPSGSPSSPTEPETDQDRRGWPPGGSSFSTSAPASASNLAQ